MSIRTIMVGLLAAICGIAATLGVNQMRNKSRSTVSSENQVVVARLAIDQGKQLTREMLSQVDWPKNLAPSDTFTSIDMVVGQYAVASFVANEPLISTKISESPTFLKVPEGYRGVTIQTRSEASMVGGLIAPGNRVDLILTINKRHELLGGPMTLTLLENVAVLAVGQTTNLPTQNSVTNDGYESVTLLVTPEMAEEINLAAELGNLNLSLRSNDDNVNAAVPKRKVSLMDLLAEGEARLAKKESPPEDGKNSKAISALAQSMLNLENLFKSTVNELAEKAKPKTRTQREFQIEPGMRAVSIPTPDDAAGVAGLILPGDKVDVLLTTQKLLFLDITRRRSAATTVTLLENILVLAVGNQIGIDESTPEPRLAESVTVMVTPEMAQDLNLGVEIGTLKLSLRGPNDEQLAGPRRATNLAQVLADSQRNEVQTADSATSLDRKTVIRVNRGGFSQDLPVIHRIPNADSSEVADSANQ